MKFGLRTPSLKKHSRQEQLDELNEQLKRLLSLIMERKVWVG